MKFISCLLHMYHIVLLYYILLYYNNYIYYVYIYLDSWHDVHETTSLVFESPRDAR